MLQQNETKQKDLTFESKGVRGYEGTIIDITYEDDDTIYVRWETDEYEVGMYVEKSGDVWERSSCYEDLRLWTADGP